MPGALTLLGFTQGAQRHPFQHKPGALTLLGFALWLEYTTEPLPTQAWSPDPARLCTMARVHNGSSSNTSLEP